MLAFNAGQNSSPLTQEREKEMRRRRYQRGCLTARKREGRLYWYAQWRERGRPRSKELGLCSKMGRADAETLLSAILQPINEGAGCPHRPVFTFSKFLEAVYLPVFREKWKASTAETEESRLRVHLMKTIGDELMTKIDRERLQNVLNKKARTVGRSVLDHLRFRLRSIFALAMSEGVVDRNPATALFTPRQHRKGVTKRVLTPQQIGQMMELFEIRERLMTRLAIFEGMRPGEILALQRGDVDVDSVWVRRGTYKGIIDTPKTLRSIRQVALSLETGQLLTAWIEGLASIREDAWLFPAVTLDSPMRRDNVWRRNLFPKLEKLNLQWATFQVMRRTFASLSKRAGVDAHTRSAQMGNTVDVNENEYAISSFEERLAAVRKLESSVAL